MKYKCGGIVNLVAVYDCTYTRIYERIITMFIASIWNTNLTKKTCELIAKSFYAKFMWSYCLMDYTIDDKVGKLTSCFFQSIQLLRVIVKTKKNLDLNY